MIAGLSDYVCRLLQLIVSIERCGKSRRSASNFPIVLLPARIGPIRISLKAIVFRCVILLKITSKKGQMFCAENNSDSKLKRRVSRKSNRI